MTKRTLRGVLASTVLAFGLGAVPAWAETLADAMAGAYKASGLLEQNRALLRATDEGVAQAVAGLRPILNYSAGSRYGNDTDAWTNSVNLTASMTLFDFGAGRLAVDAAKETVLASRDRLVGVEQLVLLETVNTYFDVIESQAIVGLRQANVRLITQELRAARDRFEVGEVTRTDVSLAEAQLAAARANEQVAIGDLAAAREAYKATVGHYPEDLARPRTLPATAASVEAARSVALDQHPDIKAAKRDITVAELNTARARAAMRPSLKADATVNLHSDNPTDSVSIGIGGPLYQGGNLRSLERQAVARVDAAKGALISTVRGVDQNVGSAWASATVTAASVEATAQQVRAARDAFKGVQEEAKLGARTTLDVLDAEQDLLDAQVAAIQADLGRYRAAYTVLATMGLLTVEHLGLDVPRYDPAAYYDAVRSAPLGKPSVQGEKLDRVMKSLGKE